MDEGTTKAGGAAVTGARRWRSLVPVVVMVAIAGILARVAQPPPVESTRAVSFDDVPKKLGGWRYAGDVALSAAEEKYLVPDAVLYRTYTDSFGRPARVLAVYRRAERREFFHIPEACYPASGLTILDRKPVTVSGRSSSFPAIEITAQATDERFLTLYWFVSGSRVTESAYRQQILMWTDRLRRRNEGWAFIRVITPITSSESEDTEALKNLATLVSPEIMKAIRRSLHG
jgi:EpsI family protein